MLPALATCGADGGGGFLAAVGGFGGRAVDVTADWNVFFTAVTALICFSLMPMGTFSLKETSQCILVNPQCRS